MQKTTEQLQADLDREKAYTTKLNRQIDRLRDQLRNTISLSEHEQILASVRRECETKLSEIKIQQVRPHNERSVHAGLCQVWLIKMQQTHESAEGGTFPLGGDTNLA